MTLSAFVIVGLVVLIFRVLTRRRESAEQLLSNVLALDPTTGFQPAGTELDWAALRLTCLGKMGSVKSYCTKTVMQDFMNDKLASRNYVLRQWRADYSRPDRWHVTQQGMIKDRVVWDEWISIGSQNFQNTGLWLQVGDYIHDTDNAALSCHAIVKILDEQTPFEARMIGNRPDGHVVARYSLASVRASADGYLTPDDAAVDGYLEIWINFHTSRMVKGELSFFNGTQKLGAIRQVFACFDEPINIEAPPWINGVPNESGTFTVLDGRVAIVPHHL